MVFYILLRAVDRFFEEYNIYPGYYTQQVEADVNKLKVIYRIMWCSMFSCELLIGSLRSYLPRLLHTAGGGRCEQIEGNILYRMMWCSMFSCELLIGSLRSYLPRLLHTAGGGRCEQIEGNILYRMMWCSMFCKLLIGSLKSIISTRAITHSRWRQM